MKLYVWIGFAPDWYGGLAFAIAKTKSDAQDLVIKEYGYRPSDWGELEVRDLKEPCAYAVGGSS